MFGTPKNKTNNYMRRISNPRIKICCISSISEAEMAISYGASALGFVSNMPSGPGVISENLISKIVSIIPPAVSMFLLTSMQEAEAVIEQQRKTKANTIQLVDFVPVEELTKLRSSLIGIKLVQVIHVLGEESLTEAINVQPYVDAVLLDSGNPNLKIKELGGTGRVHNWDLSLRIRKKLKIPIFLAGGLTSDNVSSAIKHVGPFGLDICSGVRTDNKLDEKKLNNLFTEILKKSHLPAIKK